MSCRKMFWREENQRKNIFVSSAWNKNIANRKTEKYMDLPLQTLVSQKLYSHVTKEPIITH